MKYQYVLIFNIYLETFDLCKLLAFLSCQGCNFFVCLYVTFPHIFHCILTFKVFAPVLFHFWHWSISGWCLIKVMTLVTTLAPHINYLHNEWLYCPLKWSQPVVPCVFPCARAETEMLLLLAGGTTIATERFDDFLLWQCHRPNHNAYCWCSPCCKQRRHWKHCVPVSTWCRRLNLKVRQMFEQEEETPKRCMTSQRQNYHFFA